MSLPAFPYPENALLMAPLSGYTDLAYRMAARRCGCRFAFTEMVDAASLTYARERSAGMLRRGENEDFLAVQIVGANLEYLKRAAEVCNDYPFDLLDFNLGCPVPKVTKKGAGAELGRHVEQALKAFETLKKYTRFPLSAKIRILSAEDPDGTLELCRGLVQLGAQAITIHGRIKEAFYSGPVKFEYLRLVREALPQTMIIANGGVTGIVSYREMREKTGCSQVMLARGAMGNPWLFAELAQGENYQPPTMAEVFDLMHEHVSEMVSLYGEAGAMRMARKIVYDYLRGRGFSSEVKAGASRLTTVADFETFLKFAASNHSATYWHLLELNPQLERRLHP